MRSIRSGSTAPAVRRSDRRVLNESDVNAAFAEHHGALFRYVARLTGSADVAEDVVQETFVRLSAHSAVHPGPLRPWLFRVATNLVRDEARRSARRFRILRARTWQQPLGDPPQDPGERVDRENVRERVRGALAALSERDRTVLLLREEGFSHRDIADAVSTTTKSVGTMIARAMRKLEAQLDLTREDRT